MKIPITVEGEHHGTGKRMNKIALAALIVITACLGLMFFWATRTDSPIVLNKAPMPVRTIRNHPTAGGVVYLTVDYCKRTHAVGDMRVSFVSQTKEQFLPMRKEESSKGCHETEIVVLIPQDIEPGAYRVKISLTYNLNPLKQNVNQKFTSEPIIIAPAMPGNQLPEDVDLMPQDFID